MFLLSSDTKGRADIYIGMELAVVPIFQSEITPPKARGFIVGTYQISLMVISGLPIHTLIYDKVYE